ncbi:pantothenate synthetase [Desulfonatronum thiosulfatophilum]|uniref:Pantothenate synthetase n=1 Tax=Desulfonatronum thiosulfatophilum TaxID=617002 RepID=A0A1G6CSI6_9BACT|nr:pantoate--beta-alanine ligase [Desulfonatronum thiosulfatophilum]SDB35794.1 pantothenate synthetase [Desulfonatronum thiosulfatophilum]
MQIITQPIQMQSWSMQQRCAGKRLALVPTMGYFHDGHTSLMTWAKSQADLLMVSLFVNPTQFGPREDLRQYPRNLDRDTQIAEDLGVDVLFMPSAEDMFPSNHAVWVEAPSLCRGLCAVQRPTHFRGVATVVAKLLMLTCPNLAVFGQKDWQQLAVIQRMVQDLNFPVEIRSRPTVRESDGLAMSSRNVNLDPAERTQAPTIYSGLRQVQQWVGDGETEASLLLAALGEFYAREMPLGRVEYMAIVEPELLYPLEEVSGAALVAVAVQFQGARLIDNILINTQGQ